MSYQDQLKEARQFIEENDNFLVVSHLNPDGDAASSTTAVGWLLKKLNKNYVMMNQDTLPDKFDYLVNAEKVLHFNNEMKYSSFQYVISVDCADRSRIGRVQSLFADDVSLLNIDHHQTNDLYGSVNLVKSDAAATCEVLFDLLNEFSVEWDEEIGNSIYSGLLTDTGGFRYSNTSSRVMEIASTLLNTGINGAYLAEHLLERITFAHISLIKRALAKLSFRAEHKISWVSVTLEDFEETKAFNEDLEGLVNYPRNIEGVEVGILFKEVTKQKVKISLRSNDKVDVSSIAQIFGGGGHIRAAGCTIEASLDEAITMVVDEIEKVIPA